VVLRSPREQNCGCSERDVTVAYRTCTAILLNKPCMYVCMYVGRAGERPDQAGQHVQVFTNSRHRPGNSRLITMTSALLIIMIIVLVVSNVL